MKLAAMQLYAWSRLIDKDKKDSKLHKSAIKGFEVLAQDLIVWENVHDGKARGLRPSRGYWDNHIAAVNEFMSARFDVKLEFYRERWDEKWRLSVCVLDVSQTERVELAMRYPHWFLKLESPPEWLPPDPEQDELFETTRVVEEPAFVKTFKLGGKR